MRDDSERAAQQSSEQQSRCGDSTPVWDAVLKPCLSTDLIATEAASSSATADRAAARGDDMSTENPLSTASGDPLNLQPFQVTQAALQVLHDEASEYMPGTVRSVWIEHPGYIRIVDSLRRVLHIGRINGPWEVSVFPSPEAEQAGNQPAECEVLSGHTAPLLIAHALQVAGRVPVSPRPVRRALLTAEQQAARPEAARLIDPDGYFTPEGEAARAKAEQLDIITRALSVIEESDERDEHAELITELRQLVGRSR